MIDVSISGADEIIVDFKDRPQAVSKALVRALNRSIASGRTVVVRELARDTGLLSKDVRDALSMTEASLNKPEASLGATLKKIPLIKFKARGPEPSRGKGTGVRYRMGGSRGHLPSAFIATMKSGHRGVFERTPGKFMKNPTGKAWKRQAIHEKFGPSLGHVFKKYRQAGIDRVFEAFQKNFDHELSFERGRNA